MLKKIDKELLLFFVITSVFLVVCSIFYYNTSNSLWLIVLMLTPALSVVISKLICKEGFKDLYMKPNIKGNVKWYLASYFLTPFIAFFWSGYLFFDFQKRF